MKNHALLLIGPPGSGKGTLGRALSARLGVFHCSCGEVFRALDVRSDLGQLCQGYLGQGTLVPDEVTVKVWLSHITQCKTDGKYLPEDQVILLDGIPRNANQARLIKPAVEVNGLLLLVGVNRAELATRLRKRAMKERRVDDSQDEIIQRRLNLHEHEVEVLLNQYSQDVVCKIDASQNPQDVLKDAVAAIVKAGIVVGDLATSR
jgi:adenylate kinase